MQTGHVMGESVSFLVSLGQSKRPTEHCATPGAGHPHALILHAGIQLATAPVFEVDGVEGAQE